MNIRLMTMADYPAAYALWLRTPGMGLKDLDEVAYIRFASVYRQFKDVQSFMQELQQLLDTQNKPEE